LDVVSDFVVVKREDPEVAERVMQRFREEGIELLNAIQDVYLDDEITIA